MQGHEVNGFQAKQKLLLGTNTEGAEDDYLLIYEVILSWCSLGST